MPLSQSIANLSKEIKSYFISSKKSCVQRVAVGAGNGGDIWKAIKIAKNVNMATMPENLTLGGLPIATHEISNAFASYFAHKVTTHAQNSIVKPGVYNGKNKIIVQNRNFMTKTDVREVIFEIKSKKCEGFDRVPVCTISDARDILVDPMSDLFQKIYETQTIPDQWKVAKIIPIFKKGDNTKIENYRPIANLCSSSKIFEKLILKQINYLESTNKLDLTGKQQHGFKKNKSTATASTLLKSFISRAADIEIDKALNLIWIQTPNQSPH